MCSVMAFWWESTGIWPTLGTHCKSNHWIRSDQIQSNQLSDRSNRIRSIKSISQINPIKSKENKAIKSINLIKSIRSNQWIWTIESDQSNYINKIEFNLPKQLKSVCSNFLPNSNWYKFKTAVLHCIWHVPVTQEVWRYIILKYLFFWSAFLKIYFCKSRFTCAGILGPRHKFSLLLDTRLIESA